MSKNNSKNKKVENKKEKTGIIKFISKLPKWAVITIVTVIVVVIIAIGIGSVLSSNGKATKFGLEKMGELVTQRAHVTIVRDVKDSRDFFKLFEIPFTESRQIFSYDVDIDASVNFEEITYKVDDEKKEILIKLPHAKIFNATLELDTLKVYLDDDNLFSRIDITEENEELKKIKNEAIQTSKANGLLEAADKNAKVLIESFIKSSGKYEDYKFVYEYIGE